MRNVGVVAVRRQPNGDWVEQEQEQGQENDYENEKPLFTSAISAIKKRAVWQAPLLDALSAFNKSLVPETLQRKSKFFPIRVIRVIRGSTSCRIKSRDCGPPPDLGFRVWRAVSKKRFTAKFDNRRPNWNR
jgi:hypothetical protein